MCSTKLRKEAKTKLISSSVVSRPSEKRTSELASLSVLPIAERTWEGFSEPAEQAEPAEAQMPSKSKAASWVMLSMPGTVKLAVLAKRLAKGQSRFIPSISPMEESRQFNNSSLLRSKTGVGTNLSMASTRPAMAAKFSVPARLSFSCPPPKRIGSGNNGDFMNRAPLPLGP